MAPMTSTRRGPGWMISTSTSSSRLSVAAIHLGLNAFPGKVVWGMKLALCKSQLSALLDIIPHAVNPGKVIWHPESEHAGVSQLGVTVP